MVDELARERGYVRVFNWAGIETSLCEEGGKALGGQQIRAMFAFDQLRDIHQRSF